MSASKKPPLVEVEWDDARTIYEAYPVSKAAEKVPLCRRLTVGYLVFKDRTRVILAHTFDPMEPDDEEDTAQDFTTIPRGWLVKITELVPQASEMKEEN